MSSMSRSQIPGAEWLLRSAVEAGIEVCFGNPGTTEIPFVAAMDRTVAIRPCLGLFEGVCSGAADGYYRIKRRPAMTLTHLGPGFANAIANLHNARRARSAIFNVVGEHMSWHIDADPPLASDIESLARPVSAAVWRASSTDTLRSATTGALQSLGRSGGIQTLILPMDLQQAEVDADLESTSATREGTTTDNAATDTVAEDIRAGRKVLLYLGADALDEPALRRLARLAALPNLELIGDTFPAVSEHGLGLPAVRRLPALADKAHAYLLGFERVAVLGALPPVAFFGVPGLPSRLGDPLRLSSLCPPGGPVHEVIDRLIEHVRPPAAPRIDVERVRDADLGETLTAESAARVIAAHLPEQAIVSAEGATLGFPFNALASRAQRHTTIVLTGGAIGQGLPSAFGASVAAPGRKVVALQSDGSALFTVQALWSMAREGSDVVVVLASNRRYDILLNEAARNGYRLESEPVKAMLNLDRPAVDWQALSHSFGVPATRVESVSALRTAFSKAVAASGPRLIEVVLP